MATSSIEKCSTLGIHGKKTFRNIFVIELVYSTPFFLSKVAFISSQIFVIAGEARASANIEIYCNQVMSLGGFINVFLQNF